MSFGEFRGRPASSSTTVSAAPVRGSTALMRARSTGVPCSQTSSRPSPALAVVSLPLRSGEAARLVDLVGGGDQADVAERLREVAELLAVRGVDLLREQAEVVRIAGELVEEPLRPLDLPRLCQARD